MSRLWGIDLGGTKVEGVVLDPSMPDPVVCRLRQPTESAKGYDHILNQIGLVLQELAKVSGDPAPARIGMGTPGVLDPGAQAMKNCNTTCLNGRALKQDLEKKFGREFKLANDANCFALAEATLGVAKGLGVVFGVILGTGVGGGVVVNGEAIYGRHGIGGEWGHNLLEPGGAPCYCGRRGCVETVLAGPSLQAYYASRTGLERKLPEIVALAKKGEDEAAVDTLARLKEFFGKALAPIVNVLDPDAVVLGGGVGNIDLLYSDETRQEVAKYVFNSRFDTPILKPSLGDSAGVFGAAMLLAGPGYDSER